MIMIGITLHQPYASAIFAEDMSLEHFLKVHETRSFALPSHHVERWVFIHAAKKVVTRKAMGTQADDLANKVWGDWRARLPFGKILGKVRFGQAQKMRVHLHGATPAHGSDYVFGDWTPGRWAWPILERQELDEPIEASGQQGWWRHEVP